MSADNCLIILKTPVKGSPDTFEYRAAIVGSSWWKANDLSKRVANPPGEWTFNYYDKLFLIVNFYPYFQASQVYTDPKQAKDYADGLALDYEAVGNYIEYGQSDFAFPVPFNQQAVLT